MACYSYLIITFYMKETENFYPIYRRLSFLIIQYILVLLLLDTVKSKKIRLPRNLKYLSIHAFNWCSENIEIDWQDIDSFWGFKTNSLFAFEYEKYGVFLTKEEYIKSYLNENSFSPSLEEFMKSLKVRDRV